MNELEILYLHELKCKLQANLDLTLFTAFTVTISNDYLAPLKDLIMQDTFDTSLFVSQSLHVRLILPQTSLPS